MELFPVLHGLWLFYLVRADHHTALRFAERLLEIALSMQDRGLLVESHFALGETLLLMGRLVPAEVHLKQAVEIYDFAQHGGHAAIYGQDPAVFSLGCLGLTLWLSGKREKASRVTDQGLSLAHKMNHRNSVVW